MNTKCFAKVRRVLLISVERSLSGLLFSEILSVVWSGQGSAEKVPPKSVCPIHHECYAQISFQGEKCHTNNRIWAKQILFYLFECVIFLIVNPEPFLWLCVLPESLSLNPYILYIHTFKSDSILPTSQRHKMLNINQYHEHNDASLMDVLTYQLKYDYSIQLLAIHLNRDRSHKRGLTFTIMITITKFSPYSWRWFCPLLYREITS